jgi:hypothetical protein
MSDQTIEEVNHEELNEKLLPAFTEGSQDYKININESARM